MNKEGLLHQSQKDLIQGTVNLYIEDTDKETDPSK